jgi:NDP-sugar pyrophosphorylase family protein
MLRHPASRARSLSLRSALASVPLVVIAGGLGTRLRGTLAPGLPKILAPVGGRPFVDLLIGQMYKRGLRRVFLALGYGSEEVVAYVERARWPKSLILDWCIEPTPVGTAGALRHAFESLKGRTWLVVNGDSISDVDPGALLSFHRACHARATLAVAPVRNARRFGTVHCAADGSVTAFAEKSAAGAGLVSCGIYAIDREAIESIPRGASCSLENDLFPRMIGRGLYATRAGTRFVDIGTPASLRAAQRLLVRDGVPG